MIESVSPPPPSYKDRKVWLVIFGVATVVMGLFCVLGSALMMIAPHLAAKSANPPPPGLKMWPIGWSYLAMAAGLIWLGIGSIKARRWARALLAVGSWSWFVTGLVAVVSIAYLSPQISAAINATQPPGRPPLSDAQRVTLMLIPLFFLGFFFVVLPLIWGLFYSGKNVKATCEARDPILRWTDRCPLPVLAMVLWIAFGSLSFVLLTTLQPTVPVFGMLVSGLAGRILYLLLALIWAYSAWALYRLDRRGWWVLFVTLVLFCISNVITYTRHNPAEVFARMGYSGAQLAPMKAMTGNGWMVWGPVMFTIPVLCYLLYLRKFFPARSPAG